MSGPFYLLDLPWRDRRAPVTSLLYGNDDPHIALHVADTSCITGCQDCEYADNEEIHEEWAEWMRDALNFAVANGFDKQTPKRKEVARRG